jgi:peroxiredoxin
MQATPKLYKTKIGDKMPPFTLPATDGKQYTDESFGKEILVVAFICNHCPYVLASIERLRQLSIDFPRVQFIGINANDPVKYPQDSFERMKEFVGEKQISFPYLFDESQEVAKAFHGVLTPHVMVFKNKMLVYNGGIDDNCEDANNVQEHWLADTLTSLMNGETPAKQETPCVGCSIKWK